MRMLVTRPEPDADETVARLAALGIEALAAPMLERATLKTSLPDAEGFAALALTSVNALRALADRGALAAYRSLKVFAVGERTAAAARAAGFVDVVAAGGTIAHLVEDIAAADLSGAVFYPAARHQSADLAELLAPAGLMVVTTRVYEMRAVGALPSACRESLLAGEIEAALFYSRRTAETFCDLVAGLLAPPARAQLGMLCLSEQVAEPLVLAHFVRIGLADHPSEDAMMTLALAFARDHNPT